VLPADAVLAAASDHRAMSEVAEMTALGVTAATAIAVIALTVVAVALLIRLLRRLDLLDDSDDSDSESGSGDGGGNVHRNGPSDRSGGSGGEPLWWPRFEREFAEHVARAHAS
jgi:hypothetical protein